VVSRSETALGRKLVTASGRMCINLGSPDEKKQEKRRETRRSDSVEKADRDLGRSMIGHKLASCGGVSHAARSTQHGARSTQHATRSANCTSLLSYS